MLRGALIGFGNIAVRGHVPAYLTDQTLQSQIRIVAVMDVVESNREFVREKFPEANFYIDLHSLLENEHLDFVDICTPPKTHAEYLQAFASKGIHTLCEKPLTESFAAVADVERILQGSSVVFVPCHQYKYSPLWITLGDILDSRVLGDIIYAEFDVLRLHADTGTSSWHPQWRTEKSHSGGGILVDTGSHYFYLIQNFFGLPQRVSAYLYTMKHEEYDVEDTAIVTLEYQEKFVQINLTWAANRRANSISIIGEKGSLSYDGSSILQMSEKGKKEILMPNISDKNQYISWYASLFKEFVRRINKKDYSDDLLKEAINVMKLLDLSYRASEQGLILDFV